MEEERKFRAALNVIQRLPKSGSFQPSNEMKLGFYAHFKQATRGPCTQVRNQNGGKGFIILIKDDDLIKVTSVFDTVCKISLIF